MRQTVTLTTDWTDRGFSLPAANYNDIPKIYPIGEHYIAQLKGRLMQISQEIEIVDITHSIQRFNSVQTAFILRSTYPFFPPGTIHLVGVKSEPSPKNKIVLVEQHGHYFVGANNGIFSMVFDEPPEQVWELVPDAGLSGFAALPMFADTVRNIINKTDMSEIALKTTLQRQQMLEAGYGNDFISGTVVVVDHFGNLITNISKDLFNTIRNSRPFCITVQRINITELSKYYEKTPPNGYLALFNSFDILEIAKYEENLAQLHSISIGDKVRIEFADNRLLF